MAYLHKIMHLRFFVFFFFWSVCVRSGVESQVYSLLEALYREALSVGTLIQERDQLSHLYCTCSFQLTSIEDELWRQEGRRP